MTQEIIVAIENLQRQVGGVGVIKGINAQIFKGSVVALLGKNGCGKTTLLETILGFGVPAYGDVKLWGVKATDIDGSIKQRIGFVPQQDELIGSMTGREHLAMFKTFRTTWNQVLVERLVAEWLIPIENRPNQMSVGQRQKLSILLAMAHEPELLVLDEPVASLDPVARRQFLQQLVDIAADGERTIIFSTHIVSDVERVANQVWMMKDGQLVYDGDLDSLKESVVRLIVSAEQELPARINMQHCIRQKITGRHGHFTVFNWHADKKTELEQELQANIEVEPLGLEDIFLEMNP